MVTEYRNSAIQVLPSTIYSYIVEDYLITSLKSDIFKTLFNDK